MIYKIKQSDSKTSMEVSPSEPAETVIFEINNNNGDSQKVELNDRQLYKLIGVLHLIQKEMKGGRNGE